MRAADLHACSVAAERKCAKTNIQMSTKALFRPLATNVLCRMKRAWTMQETFLSLSFSLACPLVVSTSSFKRLDILLILNYSLLNLFVRVLFRGVRQYLVCIPLSYLSFRFRFDSFSIVVHFFFLQHFGFYVVVVFIFRTDHKHGT